jgi:hypothetical protein
MKLARLACALCLILGTRVAAGQEATDVPADPYTPVMEISPDTEVTAPENPYRDVEEVAQATRPMATLAPPVVRGANSAQPQTPALPGVPTATGPSVPPAMWLYSEQIRRHDDPAQAVRRKAEARAEQRMSRIAAMKWFGFSNARPQASPIPMMGGYSPVWVGNGVDRYDWVGVNWPSTAVLVEAYEYDVRR